MNCSYCGNVINEGKEVAENDLFFCDNLCKYEWKQLGIGTNLKQKFSKEENNNSQLFPSNLDLGLNVNGFSTKQLKIRPSYFGHPKLLVDGKRVKHFKKEYFKRIRYYKVKDDYGNDVEIKFIRRTFDAYPTIEIYGNKIELGEPLTKLDYFLIGWPIALAFFGGMLGAIISSIGIITNAIIIRKIRKKSVKYFVVVVNGIFTIWLFFNIIFLIYPFLQEGLHKINYVIEIPSELENTPKAYLSGNVWRTKKLLNKNGIDITDYSHPNINSRSFFMASGNFSKILNDGIPVEGKWEHDKDFRTITIKYTNVDLEEIGEILEINNAFLRIRIGDIEINYEAE